MAARNRGKPRPTATVSQRHQRWRGRRALSSPAPRDVDAQSFFESLGSRKASAAAHILHLEAIRARQPATGCDSRALASEN